MKKICKQCGKEIKSKPVIWDNYYFCPKSNCLWTYEQNQRIDKEI